MLIFEYQYQVFNLGLNRSCSKVSTISLPGRSVVECGAPLTSAGVHKEHRLDN